MIRLIGTKRAVLLFSALAFNVLLGALQFLVIEPKRAETKEALNVADGRIAQLAQDTQNVRNEIKMFPVYYKQYQALAQKGFFGVQDRFEAGRVLDGLRTQPGLAGYTYKIDAIKTLAEPRAVAANANLISSRIVLENVATVTDVDFYAFLRVVNGTFPAHATLSRFEIKRTAEVNDATLQTFAKGAAPLVQASVEYDWYTLPPAQAMSSAQEEGFRGR